MTLQRIHELMHELDHERISYGEIVVIDDAGRLAGFDTEEMALSDILLELESIELKRNPDGQPYQYQEEGQR